MSTARKIGFLFCGVAVLFGGWLARVGFLHARSYWEVQRYHAVQFPVDLSLRQTYSGTFRSRYYGFADQLRIELDPPLKSESEMQSLFKPIRIRLRIQNMDGTDCFDQVIESKQFNDEGIALTSSGKEECLAGCEGTYDLKPWTPYVNVIVPGPIPSEYSLILDVLEPSPGLAVHKQMLSGYTVYCMTDVGLGIFIGEGIFIVGLAGVIGSIVIMFLLIFPFQKRTNPDNQ